MKNFNKIKLLFLMLVIPLCADEGKKYQIVRITDDTLQCSIEKAMYDEQQRSLQRWTTTGVAAVAVIGLFQLQGYIASSKAADVQNCGTVSMPLHPEVKNDLVTNHSDSLITKCMNYSTAVAQNITTNSIYLSKNIGAAVSQFIGLGILNLGAQQITSYWTYFHEIEALPGFIKYKTRLPQLTDMLKESAVPFDIYSDRLSMDLNFGQQRMILAHFMKDVIGALDTQDEWSRNRYLEIMKKDYQQKTSSLHELQDYALDVINYQQRIQAGLEQSPLAIEDFNRATIAELCSMLVLQVEQIVAFIENKVKDSHMKAYFSSKTKSLVAATNSFVGEVEIKLSLSIEDLHAQSKKGNGLFDLIFNFDELLQQYISVMSFKF